MLEKLWDDVVAGPHPETGLEKLRKATTSRPLVINKGSRRRCSFIFSSTLASGSMQFLSKLTEMMKHETGCLILNKQQIYVLGDGEQKLLETKLTTRPRHRSLN